MTISTATTTRPSVNMFTDGPVPATDQPCYAYVGNGKFEPSNAAALAECAAWNEYADRIMARSAASRSLRQ